MQKIISIFFLWLPLSLFSQGEQSNKGKSIVESKIIISDLVQLLDLVAEESPQLNQLEDEVLYVQGNLHFSALPLNPSLNIEVEGIDQSSGVGEADVTFLFSQQFETGMTLLQRKRSAVLDIQEAQQHYELSLRAFQKDAASIWFEILITRRAIKSAYLILEKSDALRVAVQKKVVAGLLVELDGYQADLDYHNRLLDIAVEERKLDELKSRLALLLGRSASQVECLPSLELSSLALETFSGTLLQREVGALYFTQSALKIAQAKIDKKLEIAEAIPDIEAGLGVTWVGAESRYMMAAEVSIPLPIFNQNISGVRRSESKIRQAVIESEQIRRSTESKLNSFVRDFNLEQRRWLSYQNEILPVAEMSLDMELGWYLNGKSQISRYLKAQSDLEEARISSFEALNRLLVYALEITTLTGGNITELFEKKETLNEEE